MNAYYALKQAVWLTFRGEIAKITFCFVMSEGLSVGFTSFLTYLIRYLKDPDAPITDGIIYLSIFTVMICASVLFRNYAYFISYNWTISIRKSLVGALFDKVSQLSMKSMTETNQGKLITIVNSDFQTIERPLQLTPMIITAPIVNILASAIIGLECGWIFAIVTFVFWIFIVFCQHFTAKMTKFFKGKESASNDERQKLVQDMIIGARTIKCYGWEYHYIDNIRKLRAKQTPHLFWFNVMEFMGIAVYQNGGLVIILIITLGLWA